MNSTNGRPKVLAIGLDAAEPTLIRKLMDGGQLPVMTTLEREGQWLSLKAPAYIGSGSVWPTFITGKSPLHHGLYSEWLWRPDRMELVRYHGRDLLPFWKGLDQQGVSVGVLDVPFATPIGLKSGFEVAEWWAHDSVLAETQFGPPGISPVLQRALPHPLTLKRQDAVRPDDSVSLQQLGADCAVGISRRAKLAENLIQETKPKLALIVFPETHHAGHQMWHTAAGDHDLYKTREVDSSGSLLADVYREIDLQIGKLIERTGPETVMVFALHGMKAAMGSPAFLADLLCAHGFSSLLDWQSQSWAERRTSLLAGLKKKAPLSLRKLYYRVAPPAAIQQVARPTMLPVYDWARTRAFSLPTDQYGWIRINLQGREEKGSVSIDRYEETRAELETMLRDLKDINGQLLVRDLVFTASKETALEHRLPDIVVHWNDAAFVPGLRIAGTNIVAQPVGIKTGQHALDGFCLINRKDRLNPENSLLAEQMGQVISHLTL
jgi:predicted AlkP superfamily phosphohydrolase/phosphomutase